MRISRKLAALGAFFVLAIVVAGCGGSSVPSGSVASVAGNPISTRAYKHWMYVVAKGASAQQPGAPLVVPSDPPKFKSCITQVRAQVAALAKSSDATLRNDCNQLFTQFNTQVMGTLIESYWYQAQAHKTGVHYSNAALMKQFEKTKKKVFKTDAAFDSFLKSTGETKSDILFLMRVSKLEQKLEQRQRKPVTKQAIASYYSKHKSQFATPESRDIHLVRTAKPAQAQAAMSALKSGQSWDAVAKRYAADPTSKANGGVLDGVTNGEEENAVNKAIFSNPTNKLVGPIHGHFGDYVLEITKVTPANQKTLAQVSSQIKSTLEQQAKTNAQSAVLKRTKANWGSKTKCLDAYSVPQCSGYKAPATTTSPTPTPTPTSPPNTSTTPAPGTKTTPAPGTKTTPAPGTKTTGSGTKTAPPGTTAARSSKTKTGS